MNRFLALSLLASVAACSSLVSDPCRDGYQLVGGACSTERTGDAGMAPAGGSGGGHDGGHVLPPRDGATVVIDAPADAMVCPLPTTLCSGTCVSLQDDPLDCGYCGRVCTSGICTAGTCAGDLPGHIIVIGHDYAASDPAMDRVIANAVGLGWNGTVSTAVRVGYYQGNATQEGDQAAVVRGLAQTARTSTTSHLATIDANSLAELDALVIEPQVGDGDAAEAAGAAAAASLGQFLTATHAVVVVETANGVGYRYLHGAGLATLAPPVDASTMAVTVTAPADALAAGVVSPYLAKPASVGFPGAAHAVVVDGSGNAVVIHATY